MKVLISSEAAMHSGNRKRVYLFIIDEIKQNSKRVVTEKERRLLELSPDFIADGQLRHCAKENVLFWLKSQTITLGHLMAIWFFFDPASIHGLKTSLADLNTHVTSLEKQKVSAI